MTITNTADETGDIWKNLQSIVLTRPDGTKKTLLPDGQESLSKKIGYTIDGASLVLGKDLFEEAGEYSVEISAQYYGVKTVKFEVEKAEENPGDNDSQLKKAPSVKETGKNYISGYTITVGMGNDDWMKAITGVTVNGEAYEKGYYSDNTYSLAVTDGMISLDKAGFTENENIVVISATGYEDLEVVLDKSGKQVIEKASIMAIELPEMIVNTEIQLSTQILLRKRSRLFRKRFPGKTLSFLKRKFPVRRLRRKTAKKAPKTQKMSKTPEMQKRRKQKTKQKQQQSLSRTQRMQQKKMYWKRQQSSKENTQIRVEKKPAG